MSKTTVMPGRRALGFLNWLGQFSYQAILPTLLLVAWDDTDSPTGGCTTALLIPVLRTTGLAPRGAPRLVRLNPNVAWKTRGNGAVCVELVQPTGPHVQIGEWQGNEIHAYPEGEPVAATEAWLDAIWAVIQQLAQPDALPGLALFDDPPLSHAYWAAVQTFVAPATFAAEWARSTGDGRALTGCVAAAAWPGPASSYELIAYRSPPNCGTPRNITAESLQRLDAVGVTFHSYDAENAKLACVPNTPCPVLLGLRGTSMDALLMAGRRALLDAAQEPMDAWILWATNQASGDHVMPATSFEAVPQDATVRMTVTAGEPAWIQGGHVVLPIIDDAGATRDALAYEPTKHFRHHIAALLPGDRLEVVGSLKESLHLESVRLLDAVPARSPPACCVQMKSRGAGAGYKCPKCGKQAPALETARELDQWEVPVMARRHLHRPLTWEPQPRQPDR